MVIGLVPIYMTILYVGAITVPGVGVLGQAMAGAPGSLLDWSHGPMYGFLSWMMARTLEHKGWPYVYALCVAMPAAFIFGVWTEVIQASIPGRTTSVDDLVLDASGIAAAAALHIWRRERNVTRAQRNSTEIFEARNSYQEG